MRQYKLLKAKVENILVNKKFLLFITNFIIDNLSISSFY